MVRPRPATDGIDHKAGNWSTDVPNDTLDSTHPRGNVVQQYQQYSSSSSNNLTITTTVSSKTHFTALLLAFFMVCCLCYHSQQVLLRFVMLLGVCVCPFVRSFVCSLTCVRAENVWDGGSVIYYAALIGNDIWRIEWSSAR